MTPTRPSDPIAATLPIRTVASLTGVNPITLRAWERRYGLVKPVRTASGHRLYTQADVDTVQRVLALLEQGVSVGQARHALAAPAGRPAARSADPWAAHRAQLAAAIEQFDEARLEQVYDEMLALHPIERVTRLALMPLLQSLGARWRERLGGVAEEHFFAVYLRNKLGARFHHRGSGANGPKLVVACLPGEHHETGALLFALAAHERGLRQVLLGADLPLPELAYAARRAMADAVVLSGSGEPADGVLGDQMAQLVDSVARPVYVGGPVSVRHRDQLTAAGAVALGTDIEAGLNRIHRALRPT